MKYLVLTLILVAFIACNKSEEIEFQDGYPTFLAGNWYAYDFQGKFISIDSLNFISTEKPDNAEGPFYVSTALDPNSNDSLVVQNIYDSGIRVKCKIDSNHFYTSYGKQLDVINYGQYDIHYVSLKGYVIGAEKQDQQILMFIGLYDRYKNKFDSVMTYGTRKTGWENYQLND